MSDESERQKRLGPAIHQRLTNVHSVQLDVNAAQCPTVKEESSGKKPKMIQQLTEKVEKLTSMVELMKQEPVNTDSKVRTGQPLLERKIRS